MTENQKKIAIVIIIGIIALFLLMRRNGPSNTIVNQAGAAPINVSIPSMNLPDRTGYTINIPGLPSYSPYQYSPISPCMCNGSAVAQQSNNQGPLIQFITNEGSSGPNIYNAQPAAAPVLHYGVIGTGPGYNTWGYFTYGPGGTINPV